MGAEEEDCSGGSFLFLRLVLFCEDEAGADGAEIEVLMWMALTMRLKHSRVYAATCRH